MLATKEQTSVQTMVAERDENKELIYLELATTIKQANESGWKIAELVFKLHKLGDTDIKIAERLKAMGVQLERPSITIYRNVYDYYVHKLDIFEAVKDEPIHKLYALLVFFRDMGLSRATVLELIEEMRGMTRQQAVEHMEKLTGKEREDRPASIVVDRTVYELFNEWKAKLLAAAQAAGENVDEISNTAALERALAILNEIPHDQLVKIWLALHGEGGEQ